MFIKVKAGLYPPKGELHFSEYAVNTDEIIAVWDRYTFNGRVTYVRISMSNGVEFECEDPFEYFEKNLGDKFARFNIDESVGVLANKKMYFISTA